MKIAVGCDHAGYAIKDLVAATLTSMPASSGMTFAE